jgi:hypothetical protein
MSRKESISLLSGMLDWRKYKLNTWNSEIQPHYFRAEVAALKTAIRLLADLRQLGEPGATSPRSQDRDDRQRSIHQIRFE